ncbi:MAG: hypothetical protein A2Z88_04050 [Omnitrophica WOR_2 bacterium GWA2_47_8]|nr:MAG: hypothetical protein A2Z88_04050 [Omnitrophica WOR_2 bacterium GWA2_47_8]
MEERYKRDILLHVNKPQEQILFTFYIMCFLILAAFMGMAYLVVKHPLFADTGDMHSLVKSSFSGLKLIIISLGILMGGAFFMLIYWIYYITNKILGPYDRILRELDIVIDAPAHLRKPLKVRPGDQMFGELLKRINFLIERR